MKRALGLLILLAACSRNEPVAPAEAPAAAPAPQATGPVVAFLGDSITAGYALRAEQAYPALIRQQLEREGLPFRLMNAGVSGDTTAGGLRRVDWLLTQKPQVVVIELGANDGMRGAKLEDIEKNLRGVIERVRAANAKPVLLGMRLPPSYGEPYASEFAGVYDRVAKDLEVPFVPFFMAGVAGMQELNQADGIHPTPEGHVKLAANVAPTLAEVLRP